MIVYKRQRMTGYFLILQPSKLPRSFCFDHSAHLYFHPLSFRDVYFFMPSQGLLCC